MAETNTTSTTPPSTAVRAGIDAHALHALADHIAKHHLPTPGSIELDEQHIEFHLPASDAEVWVASLGGCVDDFANAGRGTSPDVRVLTVEGRLPDTGVRVVIEWVQIYTGPRAVRSGVTL